MKLAYLIALSVPVSASWKITKKTELAYLSCARVIGEVQQYTDVEEEVQQLLCAYEPARGSVSHCLISNFGQDTKYLQPFIESCSGVINSSEVLIDSFKNASHYLHKDWQHNSKDNLLAYPVSVNSSDVRRAYEDYWRMYLNYNNHIYYGIILICYWFAIFAAAAFFHAAGAILPQLITKCHGPVINTLRKHIALSPLFSWSHAQMKFQSTFFEMNVPLRMESLAIFVWWVLCFVFIGVSTSPSSTQLRIDLIGQRTGVLAMFSVPVLILCAGRNNILIWLTGWTYSRFMVFHRWISRMTALLALIHAILFSVSRSKMGFYPQILLVKYVTFGLIALISICTMCIHSLRFFRNNCYELFVLCHNCFGVLFIASGWVHLSDLSGTEFFYAATAIWGFDKLCRLCRLVHFGVQTAVIELISDETLKVTIPKPLHWNPKPGSYGYLYFFKLTCFWQAHPFSMVDSAVNPGTVTFYVKVKGGLTHSLYRSFKQSGNQSIKMRVSVEGPYHVSTPIHRFDNVVFFSGGHGIPVMYAQAKDLLEKYSEQDKKNIRIYWVIRDLKSISWFMTELLSLKSLPIEVVIYVTGLDSSRMSVYDGGHGLLIQPDKLGNYIESSEQEERKLSNLSSSSFFSLLETLGHIEFRFGRPNIRQLVSQGIQHSLGSIAFVTCAHPAMVDDIRQSIREEVILQRGKRIEYFEELQSF